MLNRKENRKWCLRGKYHRIESGGGGGRARDRTIGGRDGEFGFCKWQRHIFLGEGAAINKSEGADLPAWLSSALSSGPILRSLLPGPDSVFRCCPDSATSSIVPVVSKSQGSKITSSTGNSSSLSDCAAKKKYQEIAFDVNKKEHRSIL
jgi:hypothetical protein